MSTSIRRACALVTMAAAHLVSQAAHACGERAVQHQRAVRLGQPDEVHGAPVPGGPLECRLPAAGLGQRRGHLAAQPRRAVPAHVYTCVLGDTVCCQGALIILVSRFNQRLPPTSSSLARKAQLPAWAGLPRQRSSALLCAVGVPGDECD